ncbi:HK97 family phage prohead protease [Kocuria sp. CPCC 205300]|uniref:HK97 family phage prohead protease n=1 Tax=Kocuria sabuli TaxID=3071448 RepID=UPI0036D83245
METKNLAVNIKAVDENEAGTEGTFEAIVSAFGNIDSYGDVMAKGAFADSLKSWEDSGDPIPVVWSHAKDDPFSHIGTVVEAKETDDGLWVKAQLDLENPTAVQVHKLLKGRRVRQFSFAYSVRDSGPIEVDGIKATELRSVDLYEVGPTLVGANPATQLLGVKSAEVKAGRVLSAKNTEVVNNAISALKAAESALKELLSAADTSDEGKANSGQEGKAEDQGKAKDDASEELTPGKAEDHPAEESVDTKSIDDYIKTIELEEIL